jgi:bacterioferritin-associated ferredoxin
MEWMLRGGAKPGTVINELELARQFGVATTGIREFLIRFSRFGLIEKRSNSGWLFKGFTEDFALELFEIRVLDHFVVGDAEVVSFADPVRGTYARLVIDENGKLAGAVMLGDNPMVGQVVQLFDTGDPVPRDRRTLLMGRPGESVSVAPETPASMPAEAVVCRCNNVTKQELTDAFRGGARTPEALSDATQASTGCGTCVEDVAGVCKWLGETVSGIGEAAALLNEVST